MALSKPLSAQKKKIGQVLQDKIFFTLETDAEQGHDAVCLVMEQGEEYDVMGSIEKIVYKVSAGSIMKVSACDCGMSMD